MAIMRQIEGEKGTIHPFVAAFIGGYYVFGEHDKINEQVKLLELQHNSYRSLVFVLCIPL